MSAKPAATGRRSGVLSVFYVRSASLRDVRMCINIYVAIHLPTENRIAMSSAGLRRRIAKYLINNCPLITEKWLFVFVER